MDCPECGTPLVTYRLGDHESPVCEQCGYVDIEAEHRGGRARAESWSDALCRFYGSSASGDPTVPVRTVDRTDTSRRARAETWADALRRFYDASTGERGTTAGVGDADGATDRATSPTPVPVAFEGLTAVRRTERPITVSDDRSGTTELSAAESEEP